MIFDRSSFSTAVELMPLNQEVVGSNPPGAGLFSLYHYQERVLEQLLCGNVIFLRKKDAWAIETY